DEVEQHLLVISAQANNAFGIVTAELPNMFDASRHISAAIDQIAKKNELVSGGVSRQEIQQRLKLSAAAVNVAYDESFHLDRVRSSALRRSYACRMLPPEGGTPSSYCPALSF